MDKAGQQYWNMNWESATTVKFEPGRSGIAHYRDRMLGHLIGRVLDNLTTDSTVLEAGCADSTILPYIARDLGFHVAGVDYSPNGCERLRRHLQREGLTAQIECCDVFNPPETLTGRFDAVMSFGLVEHFTDTPHIVSALASFLRPGGRMLTIVPNMHGLVGFVQRLAARSIYDVHEQLSPHELAIAHEASGLEVVEADYLLPVGFGVVNYQEAGALYQFRRAMVGTLARLSIAAWYVDEHIVTLPKISLFSP